MLIKLERALRSVCVFVCVCVSAPAYSTGVSVNDGAGLRGGEILVVIKIAILSL